MDPLRSIHARVAALARHRADNDPEVVTAREALAVCRDETYARRAISALPPAARARILATLEGTSTRV